MIRADFPKLYRRTTPKLWFTTWSTLEPAPVDYDRKTLDLTGAVVTLYAKTAPDAETALSFSQVCTVPVAAEGKYWVKLTTSQTDLEGVLYCEVRAVWSSGQYAGEDQVLLRFHLEFVESLKP